LLELSGHQCSDLAYVIIYFLLHLLGVLYGAAIRYHWGICWIDERECRRDQAPDLEPATFPRPGYLRCVSPSDSDATWKASRTEMKYILCIPHARDEATIKPQPTRHVDYLSHDWEEEDIWSSWKCFVSHRGEYRDSRRLENAMWRAWTKAKKKLKTVRPETLNWYVEFVQVFIGTEVLG
jgi:hypothetical protein